MFQRRALLFVSEIAREAGIPMLVAIGILAIAAAAPILAHAFGIAA